MDFFTIALHQKLFSYYSAVVYLEQNVQNVFKFTFYDLILWLVFDFMKSSEI